MNRENTPIEGLTLETKKAAAGIHNAYVKLPGVDKPVSRFVYGTAILPMLAGQDWNAQLDAAFESGINIFDTARNYGGAEASLGRWLCSRGCREQVVILSKCAHPDEQGKRVNEKAIRADFAQSQEFLGTDCIDLYLLHRDDPEVPAGEVVELMNELLQEGKIRAYGGSNWTTARIAQANAYAKDHGLVPMTVSSPNYSLAYQQQDPWGGGCVSLTGPENADQRAYYRETGMPVFAYSSLGRGFFSGRFQSSEPETMRQVLDAVALKAYDRDDNLQRLARCEVLAKQFGVSVSQIAMKWLFTQEMNLLAVVSTKTQKRIEENFAALALPMTERQAAWLNLECDNYE